MNVGNNVLQPRKVKSGEATEIANRVKTNQKIIRNQARRRLRVSREVLNARVTI